MNKIAGKVYGEKILKAALWCCIILSLSLGLSACTKREMKSVLDDIARDTYEANEKRIRSDNIENQLQIDGPLTYDQYERDRRKLLAGEDARPSETEKKMFKPN